MVMLLLLSFLIGAVLGMRFKVLVLVPAIAGTLPIAVAIEISHQQGLASIILVSAATVALVQIGYLAGIAVHRGLATARISAREGSSLPVRKLLPR
jgi:hypothetical protein